MSAFVITSPAFTCSMASLLSKFRIEYASLTMINDISEPPKEETVAMFNKLLEGFRDDDTKDGGECVSVSVSIRDKTKMR